VRATAILGRGCSAKQLKPFQTDPTIQWQIAQPTSAESADVALILGGDGTIHRHLKLLVELALPVLVVPTGSGNDFARALGLRSVKHSLVAWRKFLTGAGNIRSIDLGLISSIQQPAGGSPAPHETYFCTVAGVGLDAEVTRRANRLPRWVRGHGGYALTALPAIFHYAPLPMKISAHEGAEWRVRSEGSTILAAFANTGIYGGGMKIAPRAQMDDGLLDACVIGGMDPFRLACLFPTVYFGRHLRIREVQYFQAARYRLEPGHPLDVYADGEFVCRTPVEIGIAPGGLRVITP
jgi:diacylglycerol kinase (ATP)